MNRRSVLKGALAGVGTLVAGPAWAEQCRRREVSPKQTKGPFYPTSRLADQNADLVRVEGGTKDALGQKVLIRGQVVDETCFPVVGALVDLWQACASGRYQHSADPNPAPADPHFQYSAQILTDEAGRFAVRTIIPGAYPADDNWMRPPHIHWRLAKTGFRELVTQTYFDSFTELNAKDSILHGLTNEQQSTVIVAMRVAIEADHTFGGVDFAGDLTLTLSKL